MTSIPVSRSVPGPDHRGTTLEVDAAARAPRFLVARFAIAVAVALVLVGLVTGWVVGQQVRDEHERFATLHAVFVRDAIVAPALDGVPLSEPLPAPAAAGLAQLIRARVIDDNVRRVRAWSASGQVLLSDDTSQIGWRFPEVREYLAKAVSGPASTVTSVGGPWMIADTGLVEEAFVTFLPLGEGTFLEVVQDHEPTRAAIERSSDALAATRAVELAVVFALILPLALGASRRLRRQASDLTERTRELSRLLATEQDTANRLRELDRMKNTFLTAVSHELRTPLTVVRGLASTVLRRHRDLAPDRTHDLLARIDANAQRLDELLADLLDVDHLTRGVITPRRVPTDLHELVHRAVDHVASGGHHVVVDVPSLVADVDPSQVERIVENLVANAVRHTPAGTRIEVSVEERDGGLEIVVADDGPGVPPGLDRAVFEPFTQGPIADEHSPGTGIGLSLVARFAELHEGRAWLDRSDPRGATFRVRLRAITGHAPSEPSLAATATDVTAPRVGS